MPRWAGLLALWVAGCAAANATHVVVGQTVDLSGSFADFGESSRAGLQAAFCEVNAAGGVLGRNVTLVTLDDAHDPAIAQQNFALLTGLHNASILAASYAIDTFTTLMPLAVEAGIPYIGPHVGTPITRSPFVKQVVNVRASWFDEIAAHAKLLVEHLRVQRIACLCEYDDWGEELFPALVGWLTGIQMQFVATGMFFGNATTVAPAVEAILNASAQAQAVLMLAEEENVLQFLQLYRQDSRADPNCTFHILSIGASPSFASKAGRQQWPNLFFTQMVPSPDSPLQIAQRFTSLSSDCLPPQYRTDAMAFEAYIVGRLIAEVLRQMDPSRVSPGAILDRVYTSHLFYLDDLPLGLYMGNASGCSTVLCGCNAGLREVFISTLDHTTGTFMSYPGFSDYQYAVTDCEAPTTLVRPVLFGQLIPLDDPVARTVGLDIRDGILAAYDDEINPAGGLFDHPFQLITVNYTGDPVAAAAALVDRYPVSALLGCVVADADAARLPILAIGTYGWTPHTSEPAFRAADIRVQPSAPLELMALVSYAASVSPANLHLRVRANFSAENFTDVLIRTAHTFQLLPRSTANFTVATDALDGLVDGVVVALGSDADLVQWANLLVTRPRLTLLTLSTSVHRLVAANRSTPAAFAQIRFPSVARGADDESDADAWEYGHLLGHLSAYALTQQYLDVPFISPTTMMTEWYQDKSLKQGSVVVGEYYAANCSTAADTDCACNLGARTLALISPNQTLAAPFTYEATTCRVQYLSLTPPPVSASASIVLPVALGVALGTVGLGLALWWAAAHGQRNNRAAPKDASQAFCIAFTDIQSSTTLWASIPDVMAGALDTHHRLIRRLIARHQCYEVKTIGDSFMCATKSPTQALRFALALQQEFVQYDWGTDRIDETYAGLVAKEYCTSGCWNGLRVRVGIHYGYGDIKRDPVSKGYDYYGTVVNTAARIESVCHGGQIGVSAAAFDVLGGHFPNAVYSDLGLQPLRGLAEPLRLYQVLPEGPLAQRRFPALRIDKPDTKGEALEAVEDTTTAQPAQRRNSVVPTATSDPSSAVNGKWVETHPLVVRGEIAGEDLRRHYNVLQTGLAALLAVISARFRQQVVKELCARLHVPNHGLEGPQLRSTLHGLIQRVLPATVTQHAGRRSSRNSSDMLSYPSAKGGAGSPGTFRSNVLRNEGFYDATSLERAASSLEV